MPVKIPSPSAQQVVSANDLLEFKKKRSRGASIASFNRVQHRHVYQHSANKRRYHADMACYRQDAYLAQILAGIKAIQENDA